MPVNVQVIVIILPMTLSQEQRSIDGSTSPSKDIFILAAIDEFSDKLYMLHRTENGFEQSHCNHNPPSNSRLLCCLSNREMDLFDLKQKIKDIANHTNQTKLLFDIY